MKGVVHSVERLHVSRGCGVFNKAEKAVFMQLAHAVQAAWFDPLRRRPKAEFIEK